MGRPLNKKNFGDTATGGSQLQVTADLGVGAEACWVMEQKGSRTYIVAAEADSNRFGRVILQAGVVTAVGEATMDVTVADGVANVQATATAALTIDVVTSITVTVGGSGYTTAPNVVISGDGTGATATAVLTAGVVTSITVDTGGAGYTSATIAIDVPAAGGVVEKARTLLTHVVKTFEGSTYRWELGVNANNIGSGGASVQSA